MNHQRKKVVVIGAGFAGISAATCLARAGYEVEVLERHDSAGGRARVWRQDGFTFDMGPSWYWMPDVFESYFNHFGKSAADYYQLQRLDPSYRVFFGKDDAVDLPANMQEMYGLFESIEPGAGKKLGRFMEEAAYKYDVGIRDLVYKPGRSLWEFADMRVVRGVFRLHMFRSFARYVRKYFSHPKLISLLEFPVLFLGAKPEDTPALYSLMNYADMQLGTWYPQGGMHTIVAGMVQLAEEEGVRFRYQAAVASIAVSGGSAREVILADGTRIAADVVVGGADYHHIEQELLPPAARVYSEAYWQKRVMAPSCLLWYVGIDKRLSGLEHHNLFFDTDFSQHAAEIYDRPQWPKNPLFYACMPSKTDATVAPAGMENLFLLIPVAPGLGAGEDDTAQRQRYFDQIMDRLEAHTGQSIRPHIVLQRSYAQQDFVDDYSAFRGNAYGLANTLRQTAVLKPQMKSSKVANLYYTGQLTVPGPGVPPSLISGRVVAAEIAKDFKITARQPA
jgi:phytoene desaturase